MSQSKRYHPFSEELKQRFGCKVQRISVDAGLSCPNRDGSLDSAGCIFCGGYGSGAYSIRRELPIAAQIEDGKEVMRRKYRAEKFIAYFQAYSNTYAPLSHLRTLYADALTVSDVIGLIVATRPDCVPAEVLEYLAVLNQQTYLWLELGMQSMHDATLATINRRHTHACFVDAVARAQQHHLRICAHIILGLPGESREQMLAMADELNRLKVDGVKLHLLHVMKGTLLAEMYQRGEVALLERDDYVGLVCDFLERLDPAILVHRLTGDGGHDTLVAPRWSLKKFEVLNLIDTELERRDTWQGIKSLPSGSAG